jgi:hypothetical protein
MWRPTPRPGPTTPPKRNLDNGPVFTEALDLNLRLIAIKVIDDRLVLSTIGYRGRRNRGVHPLFTLPEGIRGTLLGVPDPDRSTPQ